MEQEPATVRLRGGDGEEFDVDARRLAALCPARVFAVPAIDSIDVYELVDVYRKMEARGWHTDPLVERTFIRTVGSYATLTRVASAATHLEMHALLNLCLRVLVNILERAQPAEFHPNLQMQVENY